MRKSDSILPSVSLFKGINDDELDSMLNCLQAKTVEYRKGSILLEAGSKPKYVGVVLSGCLHIVRDEIDGNRTLLATLGEADIFAEALCCADARESPVSVLADSDAVVLLLGFSRILHTCPNACAFHQILIANMLQTVAQKNLYLQSRMEIICMKSVRAKILQYLSTLTAAKHGRTFTVPHNREQMADYLCVERSALSHELMRMKQDGLIEYQKDRFTLL